MARGPATMLFCEKSFRRTQCWQVSHSVLSCYVLQQQVGEYVIFCGTVLLFRKTFQGSYSAYKNTHKTHTQTHVYTHTQTDIHTHHFAPTNLLAMGSPLVQFILLSSYSNFLKPTGTSPTVFLSLKVFLLTLNSFTHFLKIYVPSLS